MLLFYLPYFCINVNCLQCLAWEGCQAVCNGFRNPNCDCYNIRYLSIIRVEAPC